MRFLFSLLFCTLLLFGNSEYRYRKYEHVKLFYKPLAQETLAIALKYNVPPAAILAIAGVESGYGRGYIARISGNILSLGAGKGDSMLPALYLPHDKKSGMILYNPKEIAKHKQSDLVYQKRAKSYKKDYRPAPYAGTSKHLDYFDTHTKEKKSANLACIEEFAHLWISENYKFEPFKKARNDLEARVAKGGKNALFTEECAQEFIRNIGGKKHSFNYRQTWPKKVIQVMKNAGLVTLMKDMKAKKTFSEAWHKKP